MKQLKIEYLDVSELKPYKNNAKLHPTEQIEQIKYSIKEFGFNDPIAIWKDNVIIEGHGRLIAAEKLGIKKVPVVRLDGLTDDQRRAYTLAHNKLTMNSGFDLELLMGELGTLEAFDLNELGFDMSALEEASWFDREDSDGNMRQEGNDEYNEFLDKFEAKKTTDDCYTPDNVYNAVADWVANEYKVKRSSFFRPFYPGGDYVKEEYKGRIVVDNPPFSILAEIIKFFNENGVKFFLFAPHLTLFRNSATSIVAYCNIVYENGAQISTSFLTNMEDGDIVARTAPDLHQIVKAENDKNLAELHKELPKYQYPDNVVTSALMGKWSKYGIDFKLHAQDSILIDALDEQKEKGKAIFGRGYLLSESAAAERAAAERAAAERAAAEQFGLSQREKDIINGLGAK